MSIENATVIDAIGVENITGKVVLTISDHLEWADVRSHLEMLQEKLNAYIRYVESGEIDSSYPPAVGRARVIDIVAKYEICDAAKPFIESAGVTLANIGIELRTRTLST